LQNRLLLTAKGLTKEKEVDRIHTDQPSVLRRALWEEINIQNKRRKE